MSGSIAVAGYLTSESLRLRPPFPELFRKTTTTGAEDSLEPPREKTLC